MNISSIMELPIALQKYIEASATNPDLYGFMLDYIDNRLRKGEFKVNKLMQVIDIASLCIDAKQAYRNN